MATVKEKKKKVPQARDILADKLRLELEGLGITRPSEKVATRLLTKACIMADERTRPVPSQKSAYRGIKFLFDSPLDMASYFITELPLEWEKWKAQTKLWQQAKGKKAKNLAVPSIDRINDTDNDLKHYMRGNVQTYSNKLNTEKAIDKQKQPRASFLVGKDGNGVVNVELKRFESITATIKGLSASHAKAKELSFHDSRAELVARNKAFSSRFKY